MHVRGVLPLGTVFRSCKHDLKTAPKGNTPLTCTEGALTAFQDSREAIAAASLLVHPQPDAALAVRVNKYVYPLLVLSNVKCSAPMIMNPKLSSASNTVPVKSFLPVKILFSRSTARSLPMKWTHPLVR